ncbi:hypothetical protein CCUS01_16384 [Colletotrichum cuscutae]|uniref:Uncharacterized protein n=1 Tax=Colletotrichum cuscutae TaxID=1209917 RepID=A0AAI9VC33_9PEZI|nr:hypothetical protein CCUS01_16384 [Colletotrichum cuscutae]
MGYICRLEPDIAIIATSALRFPWVLSRALRDAFWGFKDETDCSSTSFRYRAWRTLGRSTTGFSSMADRLEETWVKSLEVDSGINISCLDHPQGRKSGTNTRLRAGFRGKSITMSALSVMSAKRDTATRFGGKWSAKTLKWTSRYCLGLVFWGLQSTSMPLDKFRKLRIVQWLPEIDSDGIAKTRTGEAFPNTPIRVLSCGEADRATFQPLFSQLNLIAQGRALAPKERREKVRKAVGKGLAVHTNGGKERRTLKVVLNSHIPLIDYMRWTVSESTRRAGWLSAPPTSGY